MNVVIKFSVKNETSESPHDHSVTYEGKMGYAAMQELQANLVGAMVAMGNAKVAEAKT